MLVNRHRYRTMPSECRPGDRRCDFCPPCPVPPNAGFRLPAPRGHHGPEALGKFGHLTLSVPRGSPVAMYADKNQPSEDLFAGSRMSFGDHIEDLRRHLWRAVTGFGVIMLLVFVLDGI